MKQEEIRLKPIQKMEIAHALDQQLFMDRNTHMLSIINADGSTIESNIIIKEGFAQILEPEIKSHCKMEFKAGKSFRAVVPFSDPKDLKIHITHVLPSSCYSDLTFIVYKVFGTRKRWWHEFMCKASDMEWYIEKATRR